MELTDEDRAAIERCKRMWERDTDDGDGVAYGYLAGMAAGIERAAKVCEEIHPATGEECAAAIRALLK